jgi:hypothetical protein
MEIHGMKGLAGFGRRNPVYPLIMTILIRNPGNPLIL